MPPHPLRPATAADRWQIHTLLQNFEREINRTTRGWQLLSWGLLAAVAFWLLSFGITVLLLAIVAGVTVILWLRLSPLLSDDWKHYWVIEDCLSADHWEDYPENYQEDHQEKRRSVKLIACAKLCRYRHYSLLFNLLVAPAYRHQGLGSMLVKSVGEKAVKPLYLACPANRVSFYTRLGFEPVAPKELTAIVRNELGITPQSRLLALKLD